MTRLAIDLRGLPKDDRSLQVRYARGLGEQLISKHSVTLIYKAPYQLDMVSNLVGRADLLKAPPGFDRATNKKLNQLGVKVVYSPSARFRRSGAKFRVIASNLASLNQPFRRPIQRTTGADYVVVPSVAQSHQLSTSSASHGQAICIFPSTDIEPRAGQEAPRPAGRQLLYSGDWLFDDRIIRLAESLAVLGDFELVVGPALGDHRTRIVEGVFQKANARVRFADLTSSKGLGQLISESFGVIFSELPDRLGVIPADAMALGIPTLLCNQPLMQEIAGPTGTFFEEGDSLSLASRVRELQRAGAWARASGASLRRASQLKWSASFSKLDRLINQLLT